MAAPSDSALLRGNFWFAPVVRGVLALAATVAITFSQDHSAEVGLWVFGFWAVLSSLAYGIIAVPNTLDRGIRSLWLVAAVATALAGVLALFVDASSSFFIYLVSVWAAITAIVEIFAGLRARGRTLVARDWTVTGVFTAILAIVFALMPLDTVTAVGLLGGYLAVIGVYLLIGGFSLKWAAPAPRADAAPDVVVADRSNES